MLIELKPRVVCGADWGLARRSRQLRSAVGGASRRRSGSVSFKISLVEQGPHAAFQGLERSSPPEHHLAERATGRPPRIRAPHGASARVVSKRDTGLVGLCEEAYAGRNAGAWLLVEALRKPENFWQMLLTGILCLC